MLAIAIALLFTLAGILAVLVIADSAIKARHAYAQLMREAGLMQAGFAVQVQPQALRVRRASGRFIPTSPSRDRRMQTLRLLPAAAAA